MLNCYEVTRLLSAAQDRPLSLKEQLSLRLHLLVCGGCRHFEQHMKVLRLTARGFARGRGERPPSGSK